MFLCVMQLMAKRIVPSALWQSVHLQLIMRCALSLQQVVLVACRQQHGCTGCF
jgi:hypothetical protein